MEIGGDHLARVARRQVGSCGRGHAGRKRLGQRASGGVHAGPAAEAGVLAHVQQDQLERRRRARRRAERRRVAEIVGRLQGVDHALPGLDVVLGVEARDSRADLLHLGADRLLALVVAEHPQVLLQLALHVLQAQLIGALEALGRVEIGHRLAEHRLRIGEGLGVARGNDRVGPPAGLARGGGPLLEDGVGAIGQGEGLHRLAGGGDQGAVQRRAPIRPNAAELLVLQQGVEVFAELLAQGGPVFARILVLSPVGLDPGLRRFTIEGRRLAAEGQIDLERFVERQGVGAVVVHVAFEAQQDARQHHPLQPLLVGLGRLAAKPGLVEAEAHGQGRAFHPLGIAPGQVAQAPQVGQFGFQVRVALAHLDQVQGVGMALLDAVLGAG